MTIRIEEGLAYTRGHPIVYLSAQSPTLDGFAGASVAVTAFHYHDDRSGSISNGCLRVDPDAITALAQLPLGTPVIIRADSQAARSTAGMRRHAGLGIRSRRSVTARSWVRRDRGYLVASRWPCRRSRAPARSPTPRC